MSNVKLSAFGGTFALCLGCALSRSSAPLAPAPAPLLNVVLDTTLRANGRRSLACRPGNRSEADYLRRYVQSMVSRPSNDRILALLGIQPMDTSAVKEVATNSICAAVTRAVDSAFAVSSTNSLLVVKFRGLYAAWDPDIVNWGSPVFIVDSAFTYKLTLVQPN